MKNMCVTAVSLLVLDTVPCRTRNVFLEEAFTSGIPCWTHGADVLLGSQVTLSNSISKVIQ